MLFEPGTVHVAVTGAPHGATATWPASSAVEEAFCRFVLLAPASSPLAMAESPPPSY